MTEVFTRLKELWDATTKGEWHSCEKFPGSIAREFEIRCGENPGGTLLRSTSYGTMQPDAEFIAYAHNSVPQILAEVERLQHEKDVLFSTFGTTTKQAGERAIKENTELKARIEKMERAFALLRGGIEAVTCKEHSHYLCFERIKQNLEEANQILEDGDEKRNV